MALTKLTADLENIQALSDKPNEIEGLTADQLKAKFDKAGSDIKTYINNTLTVEIDSIITATKLAMNPIGSIVINITNTNPSTYLGGTWEAWGSGRVPVGVDATQTEFDTVEKTGGHKLLQAHTHNVVTGIADEGNTGIYPGFVANARIAYYTTATALSTGAGDSQNLQPYITCYMWKRTA